MGQDGHHIVSLIAEQQLIEQCNIGPADLRQAGIGMGKKQVLLTQVLDHFQRVASQSLGKNNGCNSDQAAYGRRVVRDRAALQW